eukprot:48780-Pyramimonas_sp.AAC.1
MPPHHQRGVGQHGPLGSCRHVIDASVDHYSCFFMSPDGPELILDVINALGICVVIVSQTLGPRPPRTAIAG